MNQQHNSLMNNVGFNGLIGGLGGYAFINASALPDSYRQWLNRAERDGQRCHELAKIGSLLSAAIGRMGGPKPGDPEAVQPPTGKETVETWLTYVRQLTEEVAWRVGEPLPAGKLSDR